MKKVFIGLTFATVLSTAMASTTTTSISTTSTTTKKSTMDKILENTSLMYFTEYTGPNLKDTSDYSGANTWNQVSARYSLDKSTAIFASNAFVVNQQAKAGENQYVVDDYRIGAEKWSAYSNGLTYRNRARLESAGQAYDKGSDRTVRLRASHLVTHTYNNTHNISGIVTFRKWFYNNQQAQSDNSQYDLIPTIAYQYSITDKLSAYTEYSYGLSHQAQSATTDAQKAFQEVYIGANYNINRALTLGTFLYSSGGPGNSGMRMNGDTSLKLQLSGMIF